MHLQVDDTISLELVDDKHVLPIYEMAIAHREYLSEWLPWVKHMDSPDFIRNFVTNTKRLYKEKSDIAFVIYHNGTLVGRIGIHKIDHQNRIANIGYWLAADAQGRGIITRACAALIDFCFDELGLNRMEIKCGTGNIRSQYIPEKLGFTMEGIIRQGELHHDRFIDLYCYSMLKDEWKK